MAGGKLIGEVESYQREMGFDQQLAYVPSGNGSGQVLYQGLAKPGTATSVAAWQIRKFAYDSSNRVTSIRYAGSAAGLNADGFDFVWDDRTTYNYTGI